MRDKYNLEQQGFYRFLQMRHYFSTIMKDINLANLEDGIMKVFISAYNSEYNIKIISRMYNCFSNRKSEDALYIKEKWDRESNRVLSGEEWHMICQMQWKTISYLNWGEFCWKSLVRFFITPQQKRHRTINLDCWRKCQASNANHYKSCPVLATYWKNIHQTLENVFRITVPF